MLTLIPGQHAGWLALLPSDGTLVFSPSTPIDVEPRALSEFASHDVNGALVGGPEQQPFFSERVTFPHVGTEGAGSFFFEGAGTLKLLGPDVATTEAMPTTYETGETTTDRAVAKERAWRWLVVTFESGRLDVASLQIMQIAAREADVTWSGEATFRARSGAIGSKTVAPGRVALDGDLRALLVPTEDDAPGIIVTLNGDARSVLVGETQVVAPAAPSGLPLLGLVLLVGIVAAGGLVVARRLAKPHPRLTREKSLTYTERAFEAQDGGELEIGLDLITKACRDNPLDGAAEAQRGMILLQLGRWEQAMRSYARAADLLSDSDAARFAALCAVRLKAHETARTFLLRALSEARTLDKVDEIEAYPEFAGLVAHPVVREEIAATREALGRKP